MATDPTAMSAMTATRPPGPSLGGAAGSAGDSLEDLGVDVEVRVDRVDIVLVLQGVDELQQLRGDRLVERDADLRQLRDLGRLDADAGLLERRAHGREVGRLAE